MARSTGENVEEKYPDILRSEEMSFVQLFIPTEVAHDTVGELGLMERIQFQDLNPNVNPFQRSFVGEIRRFEEMERLVRFFSDQIKHEKEEIAVSKLDESPTLIISGPHAANTVDELELNLSRNQERLVQINKSCQNLMVRKKELWEAICVLRETAVFFDQASTREVIRTSLDESSVNAPLLHHQARDHESQLSFVPGSTINIEFVAGVIDRGRVSIFERVLWRLLRGNLYMKHFDFPAAFVDPMTGSESFKNVFILFVHGDASAAKIRKVADSMGASVYPVNSDLNVRSDTLRESIAQLEDVEVVLSNTVLARHEQLKEIGEKVKGWEYTVRREKMIYETLNLFNYDVRRRTLIAEGWVPTRDITSIQLTIRNVAEDCGSPVHAVLYEVQPTSTPPTFFRTNKFTEAFQGIMDGYGVAAYQEVNSGLFSIVTFPFLFAVMFGDIGHAFIILLASVWFIRNEKRLAKVELDELVAPFFEGRYIILLMGLFSLYTGLIYNDIFSKSLHLFKSGWAFSDNNPTGEFTGHVYQFGLDPGWHGAKNQLTFLNSYKMKMSMVLGLAHMTFALCLQIPNHIHFNRRTDIYLSFLPQFLFLQSLIGYLVFCILFKWTVDWSKSPTPPPSLLGLFISMFLEPNTKIDADSPLYLYPGQSVVQRFLLVIAVLCVPVMFAGKPCYAWWQRSKRRDGYISLEANGDSTEGNEDTEGGFHVLVEEVDETDLNHDEQDISDVLIHQGIHTIEFTLNCISHTASYLRLWALSLAHAQLTKVLWNMSFGKNSEVLHPTSFMDWISLVIYGLIWLEGNIGILCIMEGLSAFLHALRLHWVEGNSKHFEGGGHAFKPFTFKMDGA